MVSGFNQMYIWMMSLLFHAVFDLHQQVDGLQESGRGQKLWVLSVLLLVFRISVRPQKVWSSPCCKNWDGYFAFDYCPLVWSHCLSLSLSLSHFLNLSLWPSLSFSVSFCICLSLSLSLLIYLSVSVHLSQSVLLWLQQRVGDVNLFVVQVIQQCLVL